MPKHTTPLRLLLVFLVACVSFLSWWTWRSHSDPRTSTRLLDVTFIPKPVAENLSEPIAALVKDSKDKLPLKSSRAYGIRLTDADRAEALAFIERHADYTSYHLLFAARRDFDASFSNALTARILCSVLATHSDMRDWGTVQYDPSPHLESPRALLETGAASLPFLVPLLDNASSVALYGAGESSSISYLHKFRCCDYAYRYVCMIIEEMVAYDPDPMVRDGYIAHLKEMLRRQKQGIKSKPAA